MCERMKVDELSAIYDRCRRATPGPWVACRDHSVIGGIGGPICQMDEDDAIVVGQAGDWGPSNDPWDDAEFIAHARSDVPRLLAEVQRVRMELAGYRARLEANA
jgi:hypothetical protein